MPSTITFRELIIAHLVEGGLEALHIHPIMLNGVFDLLYEEAEAIVTEVGLKPERWHCIWGRNKKDRTFKEGDGIIIRR